jgi:hypothetical protein
VKDLQKRFGVTNLNASSLTERLLAANGFALRFERRDKEIEISACIVDDSLPKGRVPKERIFAIEGNADNPLLSERDGGEQGTAREVADRVIYWFRQFAHSHSR